MPDKKKKKARQDAVEMFMRGVNNGTRNTIKRDSSVNPPKTNSSPQTNSTPKTTNTTKTSGNTPQPSQKGSQGTSYSSKFFKSAGKQYTASRYGDSSARGDGRGVTASANSTKYNPEPTQRANKRQEYLKEKREFVKNNPTGKWLGAEGMGALTSFNSELAKTADFLLPDVITPKKVQEVLDYYKDTNEEQQKKVEEARGNSWERKLVGTVGGESIKNIPTAMMAMLSGGASVGAKAVESVPTLLNPKQLTNVGNTLSRALNEVARTTGKNPMYWETVARTLGTTYDKEIENGADPVRATLSAYANALLNAQIEIGGGIEVYDPTETFFQALARSAKEEGLEEVQQYAVENLVNKALGSNTADWLSLQRGRDAVINPIDMAEQGFYGALTGGLMGGGRIAMSGAKNEIVDAIANPVSREAVAEGMANQQGVVNRGLVQERGETSTKAQTIAKELQRQLDNGEELQPNQVKRLIREINKESEANDIRLGGKVEKEVQKSMEEGSFVEHKGTQAENEGFSEKASTLESQNIERARSVLGENASEAGAQAVGRLDTGTATSEDIDIVLGDQNLKNAVETLVNEGATEESEKIHIPMKNSEARGVLEDLVAMKRITNRNTLLRETQESRAEDIKALLTNLNDGGKDLFAQHLVEGRETIGDVYQNRFYRMFREGTKEGADFNDAYKRLITPLGADVQQIFTRDFAKQIFMQGKASVAVDNAKVTAKNMAEKYANRTSGVTYENNDTSLISEVERKGLEALAKGTNAEIRVVKNLTPTDKSGKALLTKDGRKLVANGKYHDGVIYISASAKNKLITVAKHELTHYIKEMSPERYQELEDFILKKWYKNDPEALAQRIEDYQRLYKDSTPEEAREELIADASEAFFTDEGAINEAVSFSKKLGQAIKDGISSILEAFKGDDRSYRGYGEFMRDLGILRDAERMWAEALSEIASNKQSISVSADEYADARTQYDPNDIKQSLVTDESEIRKLDAEPKQISYRAMALIDGKLYPPMATKVKGKNGKWELQQGAEIGQWLQSGITTDPSMFNSKGQYILKKDNGDTIPASYNPYIHSSDTMLNDQFTTAYKRPNIVVVEGEIPKSELTNGYRAEHKLDDGRIVKAKDPTGTIQWKAGVVQGKLTGTRTVYLTNHFKPTRIVPDSEVARSIQDMLKGTDVAIPYNVVTPSQREELLKLGVKMEQSKQKAYQVNLDTAKYSMTAEDQDYMDAVNRGDMETAQKMVDEEAKKHGYTTELYHGTKAQFNSFDIDKSRYGNSGYGFYFGDKWKASEYGGENKLRVYVKTDNLASSDKHNITPRAFQSAISRLGIDPKKTYKRYVDTATEYVSLQDDERLAFALQDWANSPRYYGKQTTKQAPSPSEILSVLQETLGYDGLDRMPRELVLWDNTLVKLADPVTYDDNGNVIPLSERFNESNEDIRYSLAEDSDGNRLTEGQQEFFKDSKVRDSNGNLLTVYHGTSEDFTVFDRGQIGRHGSYEGAGFNFTPSSGRAKGYSNTGNVLGGYLNITNPLSETKKTFTPRQLADIIQKIDPTGDDIIANYANDTRDYGKPSFLKREALHTARTLLDYHDNDVDVYSDLSASGADADNLISAFEDMGYDGLIHYNDDGSIKTLIAFNSNQFKNADNKNPTSSEDIRYSLTASFESVGCEIKKENGLIVARDTDGNDVKEFTPSFIRQSPIGRLFNLAKSKGIMSEKSVTERALFLARMYNLILKTQDPDLIWAVTGTIGYDPKHGIGKNTDWLKEEKSKFASITGNADPQYKTTIDFTTICVKTQAVIDAMSKVMMDLGRGLTEHEIIDIVYKETAMAGEQVPCPVCYVFSRWVGLGNLFGKIKQFQQDYPADMDMTEVRKEYEAIKKEVDALVKQQTGKKSSGKARDKLYAETINRKEILDLKKQALNKPLTKAEQAELEGIERRLEVLDHWSWLEKTRLADDYKEVPDDVLFDLNAGRTFATDYQATWRFRTTRGPALGKAVAPYSPSRLGDTIRGIASPSTLPKLGNSKRVFLNPKGLTSTARKAFDKAIINAKRQNRMNGQRLQSTSDFRFEYGLDYLMSFIELEAIGAKAQMYTKVPEAVKFLASTGTEVNCSIMAKGTGLDKNGDLVFSDITGMSWADAYALSKLYDNVQPILVAIGREHLIKAMAHKDITMIIPYHASGSSEGRYRSMMEAVGESVEDRTDFAEFENEHEKSDATKEQKLCRKIRENILTGKYAKDSLSDDEKVALKNNEILRQLYIRVYGKDINGNVAKPNRRYVENYDNDGNDADCYGVYLTKEQAGVMMPYEYWDKHSTIKDADKQGEAYVKYCESLGITPVFSGWDSKGNYNPDMDFTSYTGYWKTLIDRSMYNNDGSYHKQSAVSVKNVDFDMLNSDKMKEGIFVPMQTQNTEMTNTIAERSKKAIAEESTAKQSLSEVEEEPPARAIRKLRKENEKLKGAVWERNEQISAERMLSEIEVQKVKRHNAEVRANARARREESETRTKLLNIARRLDKVKTNQATRKLIDSYIGDLDLVAKSMTGKTVEKLSELAEWYDKQVEADPYFYDSNIEKKLDRLAKKQIASMEMNDVRDLLDVLKAIEASVRNGNKFVNSQYNKTMIEAGKEVIEDINKSVGSNRNSVIGKFDRFFINGTLSPERQIRRVIGYKDDDPMLIATKELSKGQREMLSYQMNSWDMFKKYLEDKKFVNSLNGKKAREIILLAQRDDKTVSVAVTPDIAISLYLSSLNEDNMRHIGVGGVEIPDIKAYKKGDLEKAFNDSTRVTFSKGQLAIIKSRLTDKEMAFANTAYKYYNETAPNAINRVSELLKGYSLAQVKNYFPINVNKDFLNKDFESLKFDGTIEGMGSLKERVQSNNPIVINGIVNTLTRSIDDNSRYVGLAIPVRNMNKLLGVKDMTFEETDRDGKTELKVTYNGSVNESLKKKWGSPTVKYIEKFMTDLQMAKRGQEDWEAFLNKLRGNYAGAVLTLNLSVAMKQTASYPTAVAVLGLRPALRAMTNIGKVNLDLIEKYTPLQWYRSRGYNVKELGDIKAGRQGSIVDKATSVPIFNWIQAMDVLTTRKLWKASEYYVRQHNKSLKVGTTDYYEAVAEIYNRVIEETQPNYTIMQRPDLLRADSLATQTLNMFKTQPFQNFNILYDSIGNYLAKASDYMNNKNNSNRNKAKEAYRNMQNALISQFLQLALFGSMTFAWAFLRGKDDKWRDEDGKLTFLSFVERLGQEMASGSFAMLPLGSDIYSFIDSKINGSYYYGFNSITDSSIEDLFSTGGDLLSLVGDAMDYADPEKREGIDTDGLKKQVVKVAKEWGRFAGVPAQNMLNLYDGVYRRVMIATYGEYIGEYEALKGTFATKSAKLDNLYKAYRNDKKTYEDLRKRMIEDGISEDYIDQGMKKKIKENPSEEEEANYQKTMTNLEKNSLWSGSDSLSKETYEENLRKIALGIEDSKTASYTKLQNVGITPEENVLIRLAMEKADKSKGNANGYLDAEEKKEAIKLLTSLNLSAREKEAILDERWSYKKG